MQITIDVPSGSSMTASLLGANKILNILQNHGGFSSSDTLSRSAAMELQAGAQLSLTTNNLAASVQWSSFRFDNIFSPIIAFQVASTNPISSGTISYDFVLTNIGSVWQINLNSFVAPQAGLYFFSQSAGMIGYSLVSIAYKINGQSVQIKQMGDNKLFVSNNDLHSPSIFLTLNAGDSLITTCDDGIFSEPANLQISLGGFYYSPITNTQVSGGNCFAIVS